MATNIGAKVELAGEQQFRRALSDINAGLRLTASELALVTAKYADNDKSVAALTARNEVLQNSLTKQAEKVQTLRNALQVVTEKYGATDTKTLKYAESLNKAEAELIKTEKELKDNSKELDNARKNMEKYGLSADEVAESNRSLGGIIADLADKVGIRLPGNISKAVSSMDQQISATEKAKLQTAALVTVVVGLATAFGKATIEAANKADEITTLATTTGLTAIKIQELNYASELLDVSTETITDSMTKMTRNMNNARMGSKQAEEGFKALRIRIKDSNGELRDAETVFGEAIDKLGKIRNETERDAIAMQIFGRSAKELNPLIEAGSGALKELAKEAHEMGYIMSDEARESLNVLKDSMDKFNNQTEAFKNSIAMVLLPVLTSLFETLNKIDPQVLAIAAGVAATVITVITAVKAIKDVTDTFKAFDAQTWKTTGIVLGVTAALIALVAIIGVLAGKGKEMEQTMAGIGDSVGKMTNIVNNAPNQVRYSYASGIDYVPSDRVALIHRGEAVIPAHENPYNPAATNARGGGDTYILQVDMDQIGDVQRLLDTFRQLKQTKRAGVVV